MTRSPPPHPTKAELGKMTVAELDAYIHELRSDLTWARRFALKDVEKRIEVAEKVREIRRGREAAGDV
jgi:hypothetical protein